MRIPELIIKDFRNYEDYTFAFTNKRTWLLGNTASGKSTVFDAIRFLATGVCRGLDRAGRGLPVLARVGGTGSFSVTAQIEHGGQKIRATRSYDGKDASFTVENWKGTSRDREAALAKWLGVQPALLAAALDSDTFFSMPPADAKSLIMDLLACTIDVPTKVDEKGNTLEVETITLVELESRYAAAFKARTEANRDLKNIVLPETPDPQKGGTVDATRAKLDDLKSKLKDLIASRGEQQGAGDANARQRQKLAEEQTRLRLQAEVTDDPSFLARQLQEAIDTTRAEIDRLTESIKLPPVDAPSYDDLITRAQLLDKHRPAKGCVLDASVKCPAKAESFRDAHERVEQQAEALREAAETMKETQSEIRRLSEILNDRADELRAAKKLAADLEQVRTRLAEIEGELEALGEETVPGEPSQLDKDIAVMEERIEKGEKVLQDKIALTAKHEAFTTISARRQTLIDAVKNFEADVTLYGPNGVRLKALEAGKAKFEAAVNSVLEPFGYVLTLSIDPWTMVINGRPWVMLSSSEKLRVSVALQAAIAITTGLNFLLVDQVDMLLMNERKILTRTLLDLPLEQAILARSYEPSQELPGTVQEGTQLLRL